MRENSHPYREDRRGDEGGDTPPGPSSPPLDPQTVADSNAARILLPEEHPREPPSRLPLLGPRAPCEELSTAQLLYSSTRSWNSGPTSLLLAHRHFYKVTHTLSAPHYFRAHTQDIISCTFCHNMVIPSVNLKYVTDFKLEKKKMYITLLYSKQSLYNRVI